MNHASAAARDRILGSLRRSLASPPFHRAGGGESVANEPVTRAEGNVLSLARHFGMKLEAVLGSHEIVDRSSEVNGAVLRRIDAWRKAHTADESQEADLAFGEVLSWSPRELPVHGLEAALRAAGLSLLVPDDLHQSGTRERAAGVAVGITGVDAAFASTGSALLVSGAHKSRAAAILPLYHLVLVPFSRIYPTFEGWLETMRSAGRLEALVRESSHITFLTGPSKSADIELNLTLGVHGPRAVHAVLFDDRT